MMFAALKLTLSPSIAPASCAAVSSQRSARAGEADSAAKDASRAASRIGRRNGRRDVIWQNPFVAIEANGEGERKGTMRVLASGPKAVAGQPAAPRTFIPTTVRAPCV